MNAQRTQDDKISIQDELYEKVNNVVTNAAYWSVNNLDVDKSPIAATDVPPSSYNVNSTENDKKEDTSMTKKSGTRLTIIMALLIGIAFLIAAGLALFAFVQTSKLRYDVGLLQSSSTSMENISVNKFALVTLESIMLRFSELNDRHRTDITRLKLDVAANLTRLGNEVNNRLDNISDRLSITLSFINQVISKSTGNSNSLEAIFVEILNETGKAFASCAAIQQFSPSSSSGNYHVRYSNGSAVRVYCDMNRSCDNITGGWMRVAEVDMTDTATQCPSGLELKTIPRRICKTINNNSCTCSSDTFAVGGIGYSKVCGRIRAYQVGTPNAFSNRQFANIDTCYVDGVSLTHGTSRQHIWTFAGTPNENNKYPKGKCPCINKNISTFVPLPPSFVGDDYFCDTAAVDGASFKFYSNDPLWDGAGCGPLNTCCSFNNPPWFYKQLPQPTTDDIEMRVCHDERKANEDIAIEVVEIYVQ